MMPTQATVEPGADPNNLTNQLATFLRESFGIEPKGRGRVYQKSYPDYYDQLPYPRGYRVPEFSKFSGEDGKTTLEHIGQFILQCGEASANDTLKLRMFPLSLSSTAFTWFTSLAPNSIFTWAQLEQKFHEYFYSGNTELRSSHLTTIKQKHNEPVTDYIRRFRDTRNRCFNLNISDKDLVDLAYSGLSSHLREKLESHVFSDVSQVLQRALDCERRAKESRSFTRSGDKPRNDCPINMVEYGSDSSDDEEVDMYIAEWCWASKSKPFVCSSLKSTSKSRQDEICFTFDVTKCDRIFDYLLQEKQIKLPSNLVIPSPEQLKKHAYCKWHNFYSHANNDCNVFCRRVQSPINEGRLKFTESPQMKLDKDPFSANMNTVNLDGKKILVRPS
jgi:hypothetical protein